MSGKLTRKRAILVVMPRVCWLVNISKELKNLKVRIFNEPFSPQDVTSVYKPLID